MIQYLFKNINLSMVIPVVNESRTIYERYKYCVREEHHCCRWEDKQCRYPNKYYYHFILWFIHSIINYRILLGWTAFETLSFTLWSKIPQCYERF